ncbi:MAG: cell envelope integrity protein TolA [Candidatus Tectomicrobia bacterium]|nr:cell envelope integrity protein TolA [Candidatus Tectomicrobia bacterium]
MPRMILWSLLGHALLLLGFLVAHLLSGPSRLPNVYRINIVELPGSGAKSLEASSAPRRGGAASQQAQAAAPQVKRPATNKNGTTPPPPRAAPAAEPVSVKTPRKVVRSEAPTQEAARAAAPKPAKMALQRSPTGSRRLVKEQASKQAAERGEELTKMIRSAALEPKASSPPREPPAPRLATPPAPSRRDAGPAAREAARQPEAGADSVNLSARLSGRGRWVREGAQLSSGEGLSEDAVNFPFMEYLRNVKQKVYEKFLLNTAEASGQEARKAIIYFQVGRSGAILNVRVEKSSGSATLDRSAATAVESASPLPPLPEAYKAEVLNIHFGFEWVRL